MKKIVNTFNRSSLILFLIAFMAMIFASCEKDLENVTYGDFSSSTFFQTKSDALAAVNAMYAGMMGRYEFAAGWSEGARSIRGQALFTTDEGVCSWGGEFSVLNSLGYTPDFDFTNVHYFIYVPLISEISNNIEKIQNIEMEETLKQRYIGELKALRAHYSQILYLYYGPVPIRTNPDQINNLDAPPIPRLTKDEMVSQIISDYTDAIAVLPERFYDEDYGRWSKSACLTGLMKLYMQEKRWQDAITAGEQIKSMGFSLTPDYTKNFTLDNKGGNSEIIMAIVTTNSGANGTWLWYNRWLADNLPSDYVDPNGVTLATWGGYRMPWKTYDRFDPNDLRLAVLLEKYPIGVDEQGNITYKDARAEGDIGAVMVKFGPDPNAEFGFISGVDLPVYRYADVMLLLAEAISENNNGPTSEAYDLLNAIRTRAGLPVFTVGSLTKSEFLNKIHDERLFELWGEGVRRDDLIRWGLYIQRAINDGFSGSDDKILYPIPRSVINQTNGVVIQNPGYN